jgi:SAM-dependent methyltransferase
MVDGAMGPNPVWQAEALTDLMPLVPGMRVLDMGCGNALSSIFLAKEFSVEVWATDLWVQPDENLRRAAEAHVEDQVHPVYAEAHALPFAEGFFDALISIGAYHYFGTADLYLGYYSRFVKRGGQIGIVQPGLAEEYETLPPPHLEPYWIWDFCAWHSPALVAAALGEDRPGHRRGRRSTARGVARLVAVNEACDQDSGTPGREEAQMLRTDAGRTLGLSRIIARRSSYAAGSA